MLADPSVFVWRTSQGVELRLAGEIPLLGGRGMECCVRGRNVGVERVEWEARLPGFAVYGDFSYDCELRLLADVWWVGTMRSGLFEVRARLRDLAFLWQWSSTYT